MISFQSKHIRVSASKNAKLKPATLDGLRMRFWDYFLGSLDVLGLGGFDFSLGTRSTNHDKLWYLRFSREPLYF